MDNGSKCCTSAIVVQSGAVVNLFGPVVNIRLLYNIGRRTILAVLRPPFKKTSWYDIYVTYVSYHSVFWRDSKVLLVKQYFKILRTRPTKDTLLWQNIEHNFQKLETNIFPLISSMTFYIKTEIAHLLKFEPENNLKFRLNLSAICFTVAVGNFV